MLQHPGHTIDAAQIQLCICECVEPEVITDCACPECTDFDCELRALREAIGCTECAGSNWPIALLSPYHFTRAIVCPDEAIPDMKRPESNEDFKITPLACCVTAGEVPGVVPCNECGMEKKLPRGTCPCFSALSLYGEVTWLKRQDTIEGKNHDKVVPRLRTLTGTLRELLESFERRAKPYLHHLYRCRYLRRQMHLDCDYFDPEFEAVLLADFATAMVRRSCSWLTNLVISSCYSPSFIRFWERATRRHVRRTLRATYMLCSCYTNAGFQPPDLLWLLPKVRVQENG
jgi:hypothetical protein